MKESRIRTVLIIAAFLFVWVQLSWADDLTIPNEFTGGTTAVAADVNANFDAVEAAVDDNNTRLTTVESSTNSNTTAIDTLSEFTSIAYAYIDDGDVLSGTSNVSCVCNAAQQGYEITILNENYVFSDYITVVTPAGGSYDVSASTDSEGGKLRVYLWDSEGDRTQGSFQFVTFRP